MRGKQTEGHQQVRQPEPQGRKQIDQGIDNTEEKWGCCSLGLCHGTSCNSADVRLGRRALSSRRGTKTLSAEREQPRGFDGLFTRGLKSLKHRQRKINNFVGFC